MQDIRLFLLLSDCYNIISPLRNDGNLYKVTVRQMRDYIQKELAKGIGISYKILNDILNCRRPVTTNTALLMEAALGIPAHILTGLQMDYNMQHTKKDKSFMKRIASIKKIAAAL